MLFQPPDPKVIEEDASLKGEQSVWSHPDDTNKYTGTNNISVNKVLRIEGVSAHCSMNEFSAIPNKVAERERHLKLRQSAKLAEMIDFDSDMSTDDEEEDMQS